MERLFNLDFQLLHDAVLVAIAVFCLFLVVSYLLFNPARDLLKKRQDKIQNDFDSAKTQKEEALSLKTEYETKMKEVDKEVEQILSEARKKAMANEAQIVAKAKEEAVLIIKRANTEAELERKEAADDMKKEMIEIASLMAGKVVAASIDTTIQNTLVEETLREVGDQTWLS
ncbi:MAG: F0F1 ATP synthase subunit B [Clostridia bacterium]|nr:F0F1 ATP synthase subunit B [Clostridia bacterium]